MTGKKDDQSITQHIGMSEVGWLAGKVKLQPYNPKWAEMYKEVEAYIREVLSDYKDVQIHHVGSTAIPTIEKSKPMLDILIDVGEQDRDKILTALRGKKLGEYGSTLEQERFIYSRMLGLCHDGGHQYMTHVMLDGIRTANIHIPMHKCDSQKLLWFKQYLIEHSDVAQQYSKLKQRSALFNSRNLEKYGNKKEEFIIDINKKADKLYCTPEIENEWFATKKLKENACQKLGIE